MLASEWERLESPGLAGIGGKEATKAEGEVARVGSDEEETLVRPADKGGDSLATAGAGFRTDIEECVAAGGGINAVSWRFDPDPAVGPVDKEPA